MNPKIELYFDYVSPYALLAWEKSKKLCQMKGWTLIPRPVVFGALLDHWGHKGPAEVPPKREFVFRDAMRKCSAAGINLCFPKAHPFNPITALRLSLPEVSGKDQFKVIDALWNAAWIEGGDISTKKDLVIALEKNGLPAQALLEKTSDPLIKDILKSHTQTALTAGVFGVPTFVVNGELFWGEDQMEILERFIEGRDLLDRYHYQEALNRPRGSDRKKIG
jgi:2-hydroxychromene-2-carboxylate isomerase